MWPLCVSELYLKPCDFRLNFISKLTMLICYYLKQRVTTVLSFQCALNMVSILTQLQETGGLLLQTHAGRPDDTRYQFLEFIRCWYMKVLKSWMTQFKNVNSCSFLATKRETNAMKTTNLKTYKLLPYVQSKQRWRTGMSLLGTANSNWVRRVINSPLVQIDDHYWRYIVSLSRVSIFCPPSLI